MQIELNYNSSIVSSLSNKGIKDIQNEKIIQSKKRFWTEEQDKCLEAGVSKYGDKKWSKIAKLLKNRHPKRCRQRWFNYLCRKNEPWNEADVWILYLANRFYGNKWTQISKIINRGDNIVKNKITCLKRNGIENYVQKFNELKSNGQKINDLSDLQRNLLISIIEKQKQFQTVVNNQQINFKIIPTNCSIENQNNTRQKANQLNQSYFSYIDFRSNFPYQYFQPIPYTIINPYYTYW